MSNENTTDLNEQLASSALFRKGDWLRNIHTDNRYRVERVDGFDAIIRLNDGACIRISEDQQKHWEILKQNETAQARRPVANDQTDG